MSIAQMAKPLTFQGIFSKVMANNQPNKQQYTEKVYLMFIPL